MDFSDLSRRALEIRERYVVVETRRGGRPWTREQLMEGFVGDVGDLMKLVMAKSGARKIADLDAKLEHELADCLWSILVLARTYGIDLETAFLRGMDRLEARIAAEGGMHASPRGNPGLRPGARR